MCSKQKRSKRQQLIDQYGLFCWLCHKPIGHANFATIDHVIPVSKGGENKNGNLRMAHKKCNERRGNRPPPTLKLRKDMMWRFRPPGTNNEKDTEPTPNIVRCSGERAIAA